MFRIRSLAILALVALVAALAPRSASAQAQTIDAGDEVRVLAPLVAPGVVQGRVIAYDANGLVLQEPGTRALREIPIAEIRELARNDGMDRRRSAWRGARVGGWSGFVTGAVGGPLIAVGLGRDDLARSGMVFAGGGTLLGAAIGGGLGALLAGDHWQTFRFRTPRSVAVGWNAEGALVLGTVLPTRW